MKNFDFSSTRTTNNRNRTILTQVVVIAGFILVGLLAMVILVIPGDNNSRLESAKWVFNAIVPLVASWVGAVIAFYFGRDNYEAATEQVLALTRETLTDINVENIMINIKTIVAQKIDPKDDDKVMLDDLLKLYNQIEKDRIPVFTPDTLPRLIIHRSAMIEYKEVKIKRGTSDLTLKNMIEDHPENFGYKMEKGFVTVSKTTSLKEAIEQMDRVRDCQDIFITENGQASGKVQGWLTNSLINRFLTINQK